MDANIVDMATILFMTNYIKQNNMRLFPSKSAQFLEFDSWPLTYFGIYTQNHAVFATNIDMFWNVELENVQWVNTACPQNVLID